MLMLKFNEIIYSAEWCYVFVAETSRKDVGWCHVMKRLLIAANRTKLHGLPVSNKQAILLNLVPMSMGYSVDRCFSIVYTIISIVTNSGSNIVSWQQCLRTIWTTAVVMSSLPTLETWTRRSRFECSITLKMPANCAAIVTTTYFSRRLQSVLFIWVNLERKRKRLLTWRCLASRASHNSLMVHSNGGLELLDCVSSTQKQH